MFLKKKNVVAHARKEHYNKQLQLGDHIFQVNVPMQRLFEQEDFPTCKYFEINEVLDAQMPSLGDKALDTSLQVILGHILPTVEASGRQGDVDERQKIGFHHKVGWPELLKAQLEDHTSKQLNLITELKQKLDNKSNSVMRDLQRMLELLLEKAARIVTTNLSLSDRFTGHVLHGKNYNPSSTM